MSGQEDMKQAFDRLAAEIRDVPGEQPLFEMVSVARQIFAA
jgi:hypothetical protein